MNVKLEFDARELFEVFKNPERKFAYATAAAINETAKQVQAAAHQQTRERFIIRKEAFFFGTPARPGGAAARIDVFASPTKNRAYAEISVSGPGTSGNRRLLLPTFEEGGTREPMTPGAKSVAVPLLGRPARPSIRGGVPPQYTFQGLRFKAYRKGRKTPIRRRTTRSGKLSVFGEFGRVNQSILGDFQWKGLERTFILKATKAEPFGGVFQRIGAGRGDIREIYAFRRGMKIDSLLHFVDIAVRTANENFQTNMEKELLSSLAHGGLR